MPGAGRILHGEPLQAVIPATVAVDLDAVMPEDPDGPSFRYRWTGWAGTADITSRIGLERPRGTLVVRCAWIVISSSDAECFVVHRLC